VDVSGADSMRSAAGDSRAILAKAVQQLDVSMSAMAESALVIYTNLESNSSFSSYAEQF
jgi:hypothetical protein